LQKARELTNPQRAAANLVAAVGINDIEAEGGGKAVGRIPFQGRTADGLGQFSPQSAGPQGLQERPRDSPIN
jgi:hypothetical protein